ncbi:MAG TPA: lipopolysaccharide kinase InaA family protein, partial [Longimicrobiales bacterium]|nr:lipopolysaccharide kinase InaA family protein [Longimicrobiales bacterium]
MSPPDRDADLPEGYGIVEAGHAWAFALPPVRSWVEEALAGGTLHRRAATEALETLRGRGPVHVVRVAGAPRVVRHYLRGGAVAAILDDRYLRWGTARPLREARASEAARRRGIPTPRVSAGAVYPAGVFYRADLLTDYVPDSRELAGVLFGEGGARERREALVAAGTLIGRMAAAGVRHPDLNARNVLVSSTERGLRALLLDLDRCAVTRAPEPVASGPMVERLLRSIRKLSRTLEGAPGPGPDELQA